MTAAIWLKSAIPDWLFCYYLSTSDNSAHQEPLVSEDDTSERVFAGSRYLLTSIEPGDHAETSLHRINLVVIRESLD